MKPSNVAKQPQTNKNNAIQIVRAIAIIAVVMIHTCPLAEWQVVCRPFINFAVATFIFLSGYLTKIENDNWPKFFKKRLVRVITPYLIWTILYSLPHAISNGIGILFRNILTAQAGAQFYYIFVYIQFVLLTPLIGKLARSKYCALGWFIAPVSILIFKYSYLLAGAEPSSYISLFWGKSCLGWFTFYYLGLLLGNKIISKSYSLNGLSWVYFLSIILQMAEGYAWLLLGERNCGTQLKLTSLLTSTLFVLIVHTVLIQRKYHANSKLLRLLGDYSFGIYLCHILLMWIVGVVPFYKAVPFPVNSAIIVILSFLCCYIGNKLCGEKISSWLGLR